MLADVRATPWDLHKAREPEVIFKPREATEEENFEAKQSLSRQVYIRAGDLIEHGMTRGCPKCDHYSTRCMGHQ